MRPGVILLFIIARSLMGYAQEAPFWQQTNGPEGGRFPELVSGSDGTLFTTTYWEIYRSTNYGGDWQKISRADMNVAYDIDLILPRPNGTVLAVYEERVSGGRGTGEPLVYNSRVYRSGSNGDSTSWEAVNALWSVGRISVIYSGSGSTVIAATDSGVYRSTDDGVIWQRVLEGVGTVINGAVAASGEMYAIAQIDTLQGSRAYRSTDDGVSWNPIGDTLPPWEANITGGPAVASSSGALLVPSPDISGIWRLDHTSNPLWDHKNEGLPSSAASTFIHMAEDGTIYVGIEEVGVFRSDDDGFTWKPFAVGIEAPVSAMTSTGTKLFIAGQNIYGSEDDGATWKLRGAGIVHSIVQLLVVSRRQTLLAPIRNTLFRSTDGGASWAQIILDISRSAIIYTMASDDAGVLLAGTVNTFFNQEGGGGSIYRSTDDGLTWKTVNVGLVASNIRQVTYGGGSWFAATDSGVYRSTNGGDSWIATNAGLPTYDILTVVATYGNVLAGTQSNGIWRSNDNGVTWYDANNGNNGSDLIFSIITTPGGLFYAMDRRNARLYRSGNNGGSWEELLTIPSSLFSLTAVASNSAGTLFLSALRSDFSPLTLRSTDYGDSWQTIDSLLVIPSFAFDSTGLVYAGTAGQGVWRSIRSTIATVAGEHATSVLQLSIAPSGGVRYELPQSENIRLALYDGLGRLVRTLFDGKQRGGEHSIALDSDELSSGMYYVQLQTNMKSIIQQIFITR